MSILFVGRVSGSDSNVPKASMLLVSEFIGCSPSLSGTIRINPWNVESSAEGLNEAISKSEAEKWLRHEKYYRCVLTHDAVAELLARFGENMQRLF